MTSTAPRLKCVRLAERQHGVLTRAQARALGLTEAAIGRLATSGGWRRARPGVYALWVPRDPAELFRQRLMAGVLWLGDGSVVSHRAAAMLWELEGVESAPLELSTIGWKRSQDRHTIVHHVGSAPPSTLRGSIPVTTPARTLIDLASVVAPVALEAAIEAALRRRLVTRDELEAVCRRHARWPGAGRLAAALGWSEGAPAESILEVLTRRVLHPLGPPWPVPQHEVLDAAGRVVGRVDFAYEAERIAIEADGYRYHAGHLRWSRDRRRQNELLGLGWVVYRVTWADVTGDPSRVRREIGALRAARAPRANDAAHAAGSGPARSPLSGLDAR